MINWISWSKQSYIYALVSNDFCTNYMYIEDEECIEKQEIDLIGSVAVIDRACVCSFGCIMVHHLAPNNLISISSSIKLTILSIYMMIIPGWPPLC